MDTENQKELNLNLHNQETDAKNNQNQQPLINYQEILNNYKEKNEKIIESAGGENKYQKLAVIGFLVPTIGVFLFASLFDELLIRPSLLCRRNNIEGELYPCSIESACDRGFNYTYDTNNTYKTWTQAFDLACNYDQAREIIIIMLGIGFLTGNLLLGQIGDRFGRKITIIGSAIISCLLSIVTVFISDINNLYIICFFNGMMIAVYLGNTLVYIMEISSVQARSMFCSYILMGLPLSCFLNLLLLHLFQSWRAVFLISSIFVLAIGFYFFFFVESPRFLLSRGAYSTAEEALIVIAKCNKRNLNLDEKEKFAGANLEFDNKFEEMEVARKQNLIVLLELFSNFNIFLKTITIFAQSFCLSILYTGIGFITVDIMSDSFLNASVNYIIDIINIIFTGFLIWLFGRKWTIYFAVLISVGLTVISPLISIMGTIPYQIIIWVTRVFCVSAFTANKIYCVELFPTRVRASGAAIVFCATAIGILLSYYITLLPFKTETVFGALGLCSIFIIAYLEETKGVNLKDDFDEQLIEKIKSVKPGLQEMKKLQT